MPARFKPITDSEDGGGRLIGEHRFDGSFPPANGRQPEGSCVLHFTAEAEAPSMITQVPYDVIDRPFKGTETGDDPAARGLARTTHNPEAGIMALMPISA